MYLQQLLKERNKAKKKYCRTLHRQDKTELNRLTNEVKTEMNSYRNEQWESKLQQLTIEDLSLWMMTKVITK